MFAAKQMIIKNQNTSTYKKNEIYSRSFIQLRTFAVFVKSQMRKILYSIQQTKLVCQW